MVFWAHRCGTVELNSTVLLLPLLMFHGCFIYMSWWWELLYSILYNFELVQFCEKRKQNSRVLAALLPTTLKLVLAEREKKNCNFTEKSQNLKREIIHCTLWFFYLLYQKWEVGTCCICDRSWLRAQGAKCW